jgi:5-methylcytosine-specific restriction endonuclease McrBC regulatory subunit McrC
LPFNGKVAYRVREYSADNPVMQLIRHTIEFINSYDRYSAVLVSAPEIKNAVAQITEVTPSYNVMERRKVIFQNLRGQNHPYFTEYTFLRELCLRILRHDKVSTGNDNERIKGIVFDGAWLWEEYLATLLISMDFKHPENKTGKGRCYLFTDNSGWIYPDFIGKNSVLDAKYKMLDSNNVCREDRFQLISYMHVLKKDIGYLIYPTQSACTVKANKVINGYGGKMGTLPFYNFITKKLFLVLFYPLTCIDKCFNPWGDFIAPTFSWVVTTLPWEDGTFWVRHDSQVTTVLAGNCRYAV